MRTVVGGPKKNPQKNPLPRCRRGASIAEAAHFLCHSHLRLICRKRASNCREEIALLSLRCGMRIHAGSWCYSNIFLLARRVRQWSSPCRPSPPMPSLPPFRIVRIRPDASVVSARSFIRHQFRRLRPHVRPRKNVSLEKNDALAQVAGANL